MSEPLLKFVERETAPQPTHAVIWMHGLGDNGHSFAAMLPQMRLQTCPPTRFVFPHAPVRPITINGGYVMPGWYDVRGASIEEREDEEGVRASEKLVVQLIEREIARGIPAENIVLAGFSQGGAMALQVGLRYPQRLAGVMDLSGYLLLGQHLPQERSAANLKTPIFMGHGRFDGVVPLVLGEQTRNYLSALGYVIEWHEYPMEHNIADKEINDFSAWLCKVLKPVAAS